MYQTRDLLRLVATGCDFLWGGNPWRTNLTFLHALPVALSCVLAFLLSWDAQRLIVWSRLGFLSAFGRWNCETSKIDGGVHEGFMKRDTPIASNSWTVFQMLIVENPFEMDDSGETPFFSEISIWFVSYLNAAGSSHKRIVETMARQLAGWTGCLGSKSCCSLLLVARNREMWEKKTLEKMKAWYFWFATLK